MKKARQQPIETTATELSIYFVKMRYNSPFSSQKIMIKASPRAFCAGAAVLFAVDLRSWAMGATLLHRRLLGGRSFLVLVFVGKDGGLFGLDGLSHVFRLDFFNIQRRERYRVVPRI